jgi:hypothetical protein
MNRSLYVRRTTLRDHSGSYRECGEPMNDIKPRHRWHRGRVSDSVQMGNSPYWKRAHQDWRVWVVVFLMIVGITIYVLSEDFSSFPRSQPHRPLSGIFGREQNTTHLYHHGIAANRYPNIKCPVMELCRTNMRGKTTLLNPSIVVSVRHGECNDAMERT